MAAFHASKQLFSAAELFLLPRSPLQSSGASSLKPQCPSCTGFWPALLPRRQARSFRARPEAVMQPQHQQHRQHLAYLLCDVHPWRVQQQQPRQGPQAQQRLRDAHRAAARLVCRAAATAAAKSNKAPPAGVQPYTYLLGLVFTQALQLWNHSSQLQHQIIVTEDNSV